MAGDQPKDIAADSHDVLAGAVARTFGGGGPAAPGRHGRMLGISAGPALFGCLILLGTNNVFGASMGTLFVGCSFASIYPLVAERLALNFRSTGRNFSTAFSHWRW